MSDGYRRQRDIFGNFGGSLLVTPFIGSTTLVTPRNSTYTIYLQRVHLHAASGVAGVTWTIKDSLGNALTGDVPTTPSPSTAIVAEYDFGPEGVALGPGASLLFVASSPGASGVITWDAYQKLTNTFGFGS